MLRCIRAYLEHDMYISFEQHTEHTLQKGREKLEELSSLIAVSLFDFFHCSRTKMLNTMHILSSKQYAEAYPKKKWNFPKLHSNGHAYYDIEDKGVSANYNTARYETRHALVKEAYQHDTNFKNIAPQVSTIQDLR